MHLHRPGDSDYDSETVTVTNEDGATASATATAYAYVPSATIAKEVTVTIVHPEHVKAETVERQPIARTRGETLAPVSGTGQAPSVSAATTPTRPWRCRSLSRKTRPPSRRRQRAVCRAGSTCLDGSGPGEAGADGDASGRGPSSGDDRRGPAEEQEMLEPVRPRAHGDGLRRLRPLPLRHRLGGIRPDGRGRRGARRRAGPRPPSSWRWSASSWCCRPRASPPC